MKKNINSIFAFIALALLFASCNKAPDTANYIPSDAMFVMGINTKELSKEVAWNAIIGSEIFDKLKARSKKATPADAAKQLDKAGIRFMSTTYLYTRPDKRYSGDANTVLIVPIDDKRKWETYLKNLFPDNIVSQQKDYKEMMLGDSYMAGWNDRIAILTNVIYKKSPDNNTSSDVMDQDAFMNMLHPVPDTIATLVELANAFNIQKDNALINNKKFAALEKEGHHITMWVNYEKIMNQSMSSGMGSMGALGIANGIWKDNIMTAGLDFEKGEISSEMRYYASETLREVYKALGKDNTDKEMLDRTQKSNLDLLAGLHLSMNSLKQLLDKTGLTALVNTGLSETGLSIDTIASAFTGDIVVAMNDFKFVKKPVDSAMMMYGVVSDSYDPQMNLVYALKIDKKDAFNKLLQFATTKELIKQTGNNTYAIGNAESPSLVMTMNDNYAVFSNKMENAQAWMQGKNKNQSLKDEAAKAVYNHPMGLFFDIQQMGNDANMPASGSYADSIAFAEGKKLLSYLSVNCEGFKNDSYITHFEISFQNKNENSLLQLLDFAIRISDAKDKEAEMFQKQYDTQPAAPVVQK